jgi:hypothetical protein
VSVGDLKPEYFPADRTGYGGAFSAALFSFTEPSFGIDVKRRRSRRRKMDRGLRLQDSASGGLRGGNRARSDAAYDPKMDGSRSALDRLAMTFRHPRHPAFAQNASGSWAIA